MKGMIKYLRRVLVNKKLLLDGHKNDREMRRNRNRRMTDFIELRKVEVTLNSYFNFNSIGYKYQGKMGSTYL